MIRSSFWAPLTLLLLIAAPGHAGTIDVQLSPVNYSVYRGAAVTIQAALYNPGVDSVFINALGSDLPAELVGDSADAVIPMDQLIALAPGERWEGPLFIARPGLAADTSLTIYRADITGGKSELDSLSVGHAYFTLQVLDSAQSVGVGQEGEQKWVWRMNVTPSPFRESTTIRFALRETQIIAIRVYDAGGRQVRVLQNGPLTPGRHVVEWDARDDAGRVVGAGVYFIRVLSPNAPLHTKVVRIH